MRDSTSERTLTPAKAGRIYGKLTPSKLGTIKVKKSNGQVVELKMNRAERRKYAVG